MKIQKLPLERSAEAEGAIVVIDVLRAFTTTAYAFSRGAEMIFPVATVQEAFSMKEKDPALLLMGEENWFRVPGFDFWNSPAEIASQDLQGRRIVHRTSAGTQGLVRAPDTGALFAASFVCGKATAEAVRASGREMVSFILTGTGHGISAEEDEACADYIVALLRGEQPSPEVWLAKVVNSASGRKFLDAGGPYYSPADVAFCAEADRFSFAMRVVKMDGRLALIPEGKRA